MPVESDLHFAEATAAVVNGLDNGLESAANAEERNVQERATQGQDATGAPWAPLAESTIRQKGHGQILFESGDMLGSSYVRRLGPLAFALGVSDGKINIHEDGTESIPARPVLGPARTHLAHEELVPAVRREVRKQVALLKFRAMF